METSETTLGEHQEDMTGAPAGATTTYPTDEPDVETVKYDDPGEEAALEAADAGPKDELADDSIADATAWLLSSFDGNENVPTQHLLVNVGSREDVKKIPWTVEAIPREVVLKIRQNSETNRQQRRSGMNFGIGDDPEAIYTGNLRIIVEGTVEPDLRALASQRNTPPEMFLRQAIGLKGGVADFIAGEILALSGFDPESIEDADVKRVPQLARAAGN